MRSPEMTSIPIDVSGDISPKNSFGSQMSFLQIPANISFSAPAAKEWFGKRRENVRPWSVFINTSNMRAPSSLPRLSKRLMKNIEYFQSNYLFVFLVLIAYCLITSPLLLIAIAASLGACYILSLKNAEKKITILGHELTLAQQYGIVACCSFPVLYFAGAGAAIFWVLGASFLVITLHASFYNIDAIVANEGESFEDVYVMEEI